MKQEGMISNRGIGYRSWWLPMVLTDSQPSPPGVIRTRSENSRPIAVALGIVSNDARRTVYYIRRHSEKAIFRSNGA